MQLTLARPDDWHLHLRDGEALAAVLPHTTARFGRAIVMPNLKPPVTTVAAAAQYRERILAARPAGSRFEPLMTLYLTDNTPSSEIAAAMECGFVHGVKYYPAGATTNSDSGVTDWKKARAALAAMERLGMPLLLHGEVTDGDVDVFDRERVFLERQLVPLQRDFPGLRIVLEHVTTKDAVDHVMRSPRMAATITAHHLLWNRNAIFHGGIRPHAYCLPVLKREEHRKALVAAATGADPRFFLGTDSAPHARHTKEATCGCAGVYTSHAGIELYAEAFEAAGALDRLEAFASLRGPAFYGLPPNPDRITLEKVPTAVPQEYAFGAHTLVPMRAGETVAWRIVG